MSRQQIIGRRKGFIIQEVIVAVTIFGIAMVPIVRGLRLVPGIAAAVGEQSRLQSWRSASEQAVLEGIDPHATAVLRDIVHAEKAPNLDGRIYRKNLPAKSGTAQIAVIYEAFENAVEERSIAAGFEMGPSLIAVPPRTDPLPPRPAIKLAAPSLSPASGTFFPIGSLSANGSVGSPFVGTVRASTASLSSIVKLVEDSPIKRDVSGSGVANTTVSAIELAEAVRGRTWAEYAGDAVSDVSFQLGDGRTEWIVSIDGRTQIYLPSDIVSFVYGVDIGRPAYRLGTNESLSGENIVVDFLLARSVETGVQGSILSYPASVRERFGDSWSSVAPTFTWSFGTHVADSEGSDTRSIFGSSFRPFWIEKQTLAATPTSGMAGLRLLGGSWTMQRRPLALGPPERVAAYYDGVVDEPGFVDFTAPILTGLARRTGRPEMNAVESINETLSVLVVP